MKQEAGNASSTKALPPLPPPKPSIPSQQQTTSEEKPTTEGTQSAEGNREKKTFAYLFLSPQLITSSSSSRKGARPAKQLPPLPERKTSTHRFQIPKTTGIDLDLAPPVITGKKSREEERSLFEDEDDEETQMKMTYKKQ